MKKLLVLSLVLGIASLATAGLTISAANVTETSFDLVISGLGSDVPNEASGSINGGVYGDLSGDSLTVLAANGNLGGGNYIESYDGWDFTVGDLAAGAVADGDWISISYSGAAAGTTYSFDMYDYAVSSFTAVGGIDVTTVPEPATMALLGLGALVLRRRK